MPRGDKSAYTDRQKRKAEHIEESYETRGVPKKVAEARAYATVNKQDGGGLKSGSPAKDPAARKSVRQKQAVREDSARNAVQTRRAGHRLAPSSVDEGDVTTTARKTARKTPATSDARAPATSKAATAKKTPAVKKTSSTKSAVEKAPPKRTSAKKTSAKKAAPTRPSAR